MNLEIYDIDDKAFKYYQDYSKRGKDCDLDTAKKRFTALILNACKTKDLGLGSIIYKFGDFNLVVKYGEKKVSWIYWGNREKVTKEHQESLKETYVKLGLTREGDPIQ